MEEDDYMLKINFILIAIWVAQFSFADELNLKGMYTVPTDDKELISSSSFSVNDYKIINPSSVNPIMQFSLPLELTGNLNKLEFRRIRVNDAKDKSSFFISDSGSALCYGQWKKMKCFFKFNDLSLNPTKAETILAQNFTDTSLDGRIKIMRSFGGEPIGILEISQ
jgi:hypothetical protein